MPAALPAGAQPAKTGGTLTVGLDGEIDTIDPLKSVTIVGFQVYTQRYEGLVAANTTLDGVVPRLAESWDISQDGLAYTFHLRQGVKFHNGKDFKAEDVKFTFDKVMDKGLRLTPTPQLHECRPSGRHRRLHRPVRAEPSVRAHAHAARDDVHRAQLRRH